jgi:CRISPR-associated RAMP protein (TIGR02581 family)
MFDRFESRLTIEGQLVTQTGFRIGTGRSTEPVGTDLPLIKDALGRPFIPGSSLKGVLRSEVERVVRAVVPGLHGACLPTGTDDEWCISPQRMTALRDKYQNNDAGLAQAVERESCLICQTFGSPWLASHVQVRDLPVQTETWYNQFQVRDGVAIDRDKGTAADKKLYNYETVPAGTHFSCRLILENGQPWQRGLLWLALRPFIQGEAALGGFTSRGLGWVKLEEYTLQLVEAGNDPGALVDALMGQAQTIKPEDVTKTWLDALKEQLRQEARDAQAATK